MENNLSENTDWKKDKDIGIILFFACFFFFLTKQNKNHASRNHITIQILNHSQFTVHPLFQKQKSRTFRGLRIIFPGLLYVYISYLENKAIYKIVERQLILGKWPTCCWIIIFWNFSQILYSIILFGLSIKFHRTFCMKISKLLRVAEMSFITNLMVF